MNKTSVYDGRAMRELKQARSSLTRQQFSTLKGQIMAGNGSAALRGLETILNRQGKTV